MSQQNKIDFTVLPEESFLNETEHMDEHFRQFSIISDIQGKLENYNGFIVGLVTFTYLRINGANANNKLRIPANASFDNLTYNEGQNFFIDIFDRYKIICEVNTLLDKTATLLEPAFIAGANNLSAEFQKNIAKELLALDWSESGFTNQDCGLYVEGTLIRDALVTVATDSIYPDFYIQAHHLKPLLNIRPDDKQLCTPILYHTYLVNMFEQLGWIKNGCEEFIREHMDNVTAVQTDPALWAIHTIEAVLFGCDNQLISKADALSTIHNKVDGGYDVIFLPEANNESVPDVGPITIGNIIFEKFDEDGDCSNNLYYVASLYNLLNDHGRMLVRFDEKYETALRPECSIEGVYDQGLRKFFVENNLIEAVIQTKNCTYMLIDKNRPETRHDKIFFYYGLEFGFFAWGQYCANNENLASCINKYSCKNIQNKDDEGVCIISNNEIRNNEYCLLPRKYIYDSSRITTNQVVRPPQERKMIKAITIENFKGISQPIRIEFKPITLLFGANSCGKSSIIQALHYLREVLEFRRLDVDKTTAGGDFIDLGGFDNFVHGHDKEQKVTFTVELHDIDNKYWWDQESSISDSFGAGLRHAIQNYGEKWLKFSICKRNDEVCVDHMVISLNNNVIISKHFSEDHTEEYRCINSEFPTDGNNPSLFIQVLQNALAFSDTDLELGQRYTIEGSDEERFIQKRIVAAKSNFIPECGESSPFKEWDDDGCIEDYAFDYAQRGIIGTVVDELRNLLYVGPLRTIPPRNYSPQKTFAPSRWADGMAAWDTASFTNDAVISEINEWMKNLNTGYALKVKQTISIDNKSFNQLITDQDLSLNERKRLLKNVKPKREIQLNQEVDGLEVSLCDIGVGISQVFPVVVAALDDEVRTTILEQPELNIHPCLQVELGDLFIKAIQKNKCMIIETHSEHLLLRLLRRIREANDGELPEGINGLLPEQISVIYVEREDDELRIRSLRISKEGDSLGEWPKGFFEERARELF